MLNVNIHFFFFLGFPFRSYTKNMTNAYNNMMNINNTMKINRITNTYNNMTNIKNMMNTNNMIQTLATQGTPTSTKPTHME